MSRENVYNLRLAGIGGRGVVGLATVIAKAAQRAGVAVSVIDRPRSAMRLGPITCDIIFGQQGFAPFIAPGDADALLAAEPLDGVMNARWLLKKGGVAVLSTDAMPTIDELVSGDEDPRRAEWMTATKKRAGKLLRVDTAGDGVAAGYHLLGALVAAAPGFPVPQAALREELADRPEALAGFEKGLQAVS